MASVEKVREEAVPDMTAISDLDEEKMLKNLEDRYLHSATTEPYTYVSTVLVAINPLKKIVGPTNENFFNTAFNPNIPHPNALAELAFQRLNSEHNQSIVVSGESGAGKTETSKMVVQYLSERSFAQGLKDQEQNPLTPTTTGGMKDLATRIVAISPVLEAFGNASTHRNPNSSRFGRFVKLLFQKHHFTSYQSGGCFRLIGGELETYLLEKSRVVRQSKGERNFHAMHMMLEEVPSTSLEKNMLHQKDGHKNTNDDDNEIIFRCMPYSAKKSIEVRTQLSQQAGKSVPLYKNVALSLKAIQMNDSTIHNAWDILGAIAILADFEFYENENNAQQATAIIDHSDHRAIKVTQLLGLESPQALIHALCYRTVQTKSENLQVGRTSIEARAARDAACRCIYGRLFDSLVTYCNRALNNNDDDKDEGQDSTEASSKSPTPTCKFIGILDIFGFEIMEYNGLETLLINYANESLQQLFCDAIFNAELSLYAAEGILTDEVRALKPPDSRPALELIVGKGSPPGILRLLDAQCETGGNDKANERERIFLSSIHSKHAKHMALAATPPQKKRQLFHISHYAAQVGYTVVNETFISDGWVTTNLDQIPSGLFEALSLSRLPLVLHLASTTTETFNDTTTKSPESTSNTANFFNSSSNQESSSSARPRKMNGSRLKTVSSRFIASMASLNSTLAATDCGFIRCIKPTPRMIPNIFDIDYVREQLRALGLVAATEVLRIGLPQRIEYDQLLAMLPENARKQLNGESKELIVACTLSAFEVSADDYRLGNTRVFFPASALGRINAALAFDEKSDPARAKQLAAKLEQAKKQAKEAGQAVSDLKTYSTKAKQILVQARGSIAQVPFVDIDEAAAYISTNGNNSQMSSLESLLSRASAQVEAANEDINSPLVTDEAKHLAQEASKKLVSAKAHAKEALTAEGELGKSQSIVQKAKNEADTARQIVAKIDNHATAAERASITASQAARKLQISQAQQKAQETRREADEAEKIYRAQDPAIHANASIKAWESLPDTAISTTAFKSREKIQAAETDAQAALSSAEKCRDIMNKAKAVEEERLRKEEEERLRKEEEERRRAEAEAALAASARDFEEDGDAEDDDEEDTGVVATSPIVDTKGNDQSSTPADTGKMKTKSLAAPSPVRLDDNAEPGERMAIRLRKLKRWFVLEPAWEERSKPKIINPRNFSASGSSTRTLVQRNSKSSNNSNEGRESSSNAAGALRDMIFRGINISPLDNNRDDPRLPMLHCIVKRKAVGMMSSYQFELYLSAEPTKLILAARRPSSGSPGYAIYDNAAGAVTSSNPSGSRASLPKRIVAKLRESTMNTEDQANAASPDAANGRELATFGQERPNGSMPREIVVLLAPTDEDTNKHSDGSPVPQALNAHVASAEQIDPKIPVFVQRDPVIRDGMYLLNFRGRGRVASGKNFQLVAAAPDFCRDSIDHANDEAVVLQFCKVSANRFHLDFCAPFTPLAAFSLAVSICLG
mmetsp:Transcript_4913/g.7376  ORF Transcript_4913/g.7376 Transcript_4913/m.7376 type:complete len:1490 (+) Transcript_4913:116-4585(+)